jgi:hypothetical protein
VTEGIKLGSAVEEGKKNRRKLRFLVAIVGFILVALELMLAFNEVALYQSLICSVYLSFNILLEVPTWTERHWTQKYGRRLSYPESKLIFGAILIPFWLIFNLLLSFIAPWFSEEIICLISFAIIIALILTVSVYGFMVKKRESKTAYEVAQKVHQPTQRKRFRQVSVRKGILLGIAMILVGFPLFYLAWFTSILHTEYGLVEASTGAFGLALIFMGVVLPIARLLQERSRRLKRAQRALQRTTKG